MTICAGALSNLAAQEASPAQTWVIDPVPVTEVDGSGDPYGGPFRFVNDAMLLSDGTLVVLQRARDFFELRYFDAEGRRLGSAGGSGDGPFEFRTPVYGLNRLDGDSVFVVSRAARYAVFGPRGEEVRSGRLPFTFQWSAVPLSLADSDTF